MKEVCDRRNLTVEQILYARDHSTAAVRHRVMKDLQLAGLSLSEVSAIFNTTPPVISRATAK